MRKHLKAVNLGGICIYFECMWASREGDKIFDLPYSQILAPIVLLGWWEGGKRAREFKRRSIHYNCKTLRWEGPEH